MSNRWLLAGWLVGLVAFEYLLVAGPASAPAWVGSGLFGTATLALPITVLHRRARSTAPEDAWVRPIEAAAALFMLGHLVGVVATLVGSELVGTAAELISLAGYPCLMAAVLLGVRERLSGLRSIVVLDGLAGALAGAAAATGALSLLVDQAWDSTFPAAVLLAAPVLDAVLLAAALGAVGLVGPRGARPFGLIAAAALALTVRDIGAGHLVVVGSPDALPGLDALGGVALGLLALATLVGVDRSAAEVHVPRGRSLGVPGVASVAAIAVLTAAPAWDHAALPTVLALLALSVSGARFLRAFLLLRELAVVREMALTDDLTGVANRRALYQHLDGILPADGDPAELAGTAAVGVALIDLDHFKEVNDTLGHAAGDGLLKEVVRRFEAALVELETPHLLARLGGDEFAVVLPEATSRNAAMIVGQALQDSLAEPVQLPEGVLHAQASVGLAVAPAHGRTRSEILSAADAAMYAAKTSGTSVSFHTPESEEPSDQLTMAEELFRALDRHELTVEYQPIQQPDGTIVAAEAFVRWDHPERGRLAAGEFMEAAGRYKLTAAIARRVLDVALGDLARWRAGGISLTVSVNLSAEDLRDEAVVGTIAAALIAHGVPAQLLTIDISERAMAEDPEGVRDVMRALDEIGVRLALDDYGLGGVALTDLAALPLDEIKLDRAFTRDTAVSTRCTAIVKSVIDLTHALGLRMVAEGVEDRRALAVLRHIGCDLVQGRHLGGPLRGEEFEARLSQPTGGKHRLAL